MCVEHTKRDLQPSQGQSELPIGGFRFEDVLPNCGLQRSAEGGYLRQEWVVNYIADTTRA